MRATNESELLKEAMRHADLSQAALASLLGHESVSSVCRKVSGKLMVSTREKEILERLCEIDPRTKGRVYMLLRDGRGLDALSEVLQCTMRPIREGAEE